jgi:Flp pilus assembly protein TadG
VALVEFVIVAPFLIVMMLALAEFGRAFHQYSTLNKAVRSSARYLASQGTMTIGVTIMTNEMRTRTRNMAVYGLPAGGTDPLLPGLDAGDIDIEVIGAGSDTVRVVGTYDYVPIVATRLPGFGYGEDVPLSFTLSASTTIRKL